MRPVPRMHTPIHTAIRTPFHDPRPFHERDTVREIDSAIELDLDDEDIETFDEKAERARADAIDGVALLRLAQTLNLRIAEAAKAGIVTLDVCVDAMWLVEKSAVLDSVMQIERLVASIEEGMLGMPPVGAATAARAALAEYKRCITPPPAVEPHAQDGE